MSREVQDLKMSIQTSKIMAPRKMTSTTRRIIRLKDLIKKRANRKVQHSSSKKRSLLSKESAKSDRKALQRQKEEKQLPQKLRSFMARWYRRSLTKRGKTASTTTQNRDSTTSTGIWKTSYTYSRPRSSRSLRNQRWTRSINFLMFSPGRLDALVTMFSLTIHLIILTETNYSISQARQSRPSSRLGSLAH